MFPLVSTLLTVIELIVLLSNLYSSIPVLFVVFTTLSLSVLGVDLLRPGRGAVYCDQFVCLSVRLFVCLLSASISLEPLNRSLRNFLCRSHVAVARFSSGGVAMHRILRYVMYFRFYG